MPMQKVSEWKHRADGFDLEKSCGQCISWCKKYSEWKHQADGFDLQKSYWESISWCKKHLYDNAVTAMFVLSSRWFAYT